MKGKKEFAILFFLMAVLLFYIYSEKGGKTHYELPDLAKLDTSDIAELKIRNKGEEIILAKDGGQWFAGVQKYPADGALVGAMLRDITGITLTALASESRSYTIYELDEERRIEVEAYGGGKLMRKLLIGKPAPSYRHTFVMVGDDPRVFHAEGNMRQDFDRQVPDLRDREVLAVRGEITEIVLNKGGEEMTILRAEPSVSEEQSGKEGGQEMPPAGGLPWKTADGRPVKGEDVEGIVSTLSRLICDGFIEDRTKDDFRHPLYTVTLKGAGTYTVSLFEKGDSGYPAVSSESDYPFLISEWKASRIMKDFSGLLEEGKEGTDPH